MASGFGSPEGVQQEIEAVLQAGVTHARQQIQHQRDSERFCLECSTCIPEARRTAVKGVQYCISCQESRDTIFKREPRNCWHRSMR